MDEQFGSAVQEQAISLLDTHLSNLSQRLFEVGKKADQQLTAWLTFVALTILLCFGAAATVSLAGLQLRAAVAAAVTYGLACAFYYRAVLSMAALQIWRESLRERRKLRFATLLQFAQQQGPEVERDTNLDINGFVSEYPGYLASSVLVKDEALKRGNLSGKYIALAHKFIILSFTVSPYALTACLLYTTWFSWWYIAVALLGVMMTLSANAIIQQNTHASPRFDARPQ
jgi:hypothetical protein